MDKLSIANEERAARTNAVQTSSGAFNMTERKEPTFFKFEKEGDTIAGVLASIERVSVGTSSKAANRYTVQDLETGEMSAFLGSYQIDTKLRPTDRGRFIVIRLEGEDSSISRSGRALKKYRVQVSDKTVGEMRASGGSASDTPFITDADIPF